jgi:hypothetical protein
MCDTTRNNQSKHCCKWKTFFIWVHMNLTDSSRVPGVHFWVDFGVLILFYSCTYVSANSSENFGGQKTLHFLWITEIHLLWIQRLYEDHYVPEETCFTVIPTIYQVGWDRESTFFLNNFPKVLFHENRYGFQNCAHNKGCGLKELRP